MRSVSTLFLVLALTACTTTQAAGREPSTRKVVVDGQEVLAEDAAWELVEDADRLRDAGAKKIAYRRVVDEFADTAARGNASVSLARVLLEEKKPAATAEATRVLEKFLLEDPAHPSADDARGLLTVARMGAASADGGAGRAVVDKVLKDTPADEQGKALWKLGKDMVSQGRAQDGVVALLAALPKLNAADKKACADDLAFALDVPVVAGGIAFAGIKPLRDEFAKTDPVADELLTWKLVRVALHQRDDALAEGLARELTKKFPASRFAKAAGAVVTRLQARVQTDNTAVGIILPLTGEYAAYGKRALTAVRLAFNLPVAAEAEPEPVLDEATGEMVIPKRQPEKLTGKLTTPLGTKLIIKDSAGKVDRAQAAVRELVEDDHVIAILGDILVDTSLPIALAAEDYGVPLLSLSRREGVPEVGPWSFRLGLTPKKQAEALVAYAVDGMKMKRFGIMYPKHAFGVELMNEFWSALEARQAEITAIESYDHDQTSFTKEARSLVGRGLGGGGSEVAACRENARLIDNEYRRKKALEGCADKARPLIDFEALFIPDGARAVGFVVPALIAEDLLMTSSKYQVDAYKKATGNNTIRPVQLLGPSTWSDPDIAVRLGRPVDGALYVDGFDAADQTPLVQKFVNGFQQATRSRPALVEAQVFDGARLLGTLMEQKLATRQQLRDALQKTAGFVGVTGTLSFDKEGDSQTPLHFFQIAREKVEPVDVADLVKGAG